MFPGCSEWPLGGKRPVDLARVPGGLSAILKYHHNQDEELFKRPRKAPSGAPVSVVGDECIAGIGLCSRPAAPYSPSFRAFSGSLSLNFFTRVLNLENIKGSVILITANRVQGVQTFLRCDMTC